MSFEESRAMPEARSELLPPRKVEKANPEPAALSSATKASLPPVAQSAQVA